MGQIEIFYLLLENICVQTNDSYIELLKWDSNTWNLLWANKWQLHWIIVIR